MKKMLYRTALPAIRTAILVAVAIGATASHSQNLIKMNSSDCIDGLEALAAMTKVQIEPATTPRKTAGTCLAQNVRLTASGGQVVIAIDQIQWNRAGLMLLKDETMPEYLKLIFRGVRVNAAPENNPAWGILRAEATAGRDFDANIDFTFSNVNGAVKPLNIGIDFHNGNILTLLADLRGVSPSLLGKSELSRLAITANILRFEIHSGNGRKNPALEMGMAALLKGIPNRDLDAFKIKAKAFVDNKIAKAMSADDRRAALALIADLPRPKGHISVQMKAAKGFAILRLGFGALDGIEINFGYGYDTPGGQ